MPDPITACRICQCQDLTPYRVREMMYGTGEEFDYVQCGQCGCLQIVHIPDDMSRHYPAGYYSMHSGKKLTGWKAKRIALRDRHALTGQGWVGGLLHWLRGGDSLLDAYRPLGLRADWRILDVGGGGGAHVMHLWRAGFPHAMAIDKFLDQDVRVDGKLLARKADVFGVDGPFQLITMHHSFEHMDQPHDVLRRCRDLLTPDGGLMIRVPSVSSTAWQHYGVHWVNLDAPRHFFLHSHRSISHLAEQCGFTVRALWCDSSALQFWGSELYQRKISLRDPRSPACGSQEIFSAAQIKDWQRQARALNQSKQGDAIGLWLQPA